MLSFSRVDAGEGTRPEGVFVSHVNEELAGMIHYDSILVGVGPYPVENDSMANIFNTIKRVGRPITLEFRTVAEDDVSRFSPSYKGPGQVQGEDVAKQKEPKEPKSWTQNPFFLFNPFGGCDGNTS